MGSEITLHSSNFGRPMSAMGQKRILRPVEPMSALPPKAGIRTDEIDVRFVPLASKVQRNKM
jgi:hypothetical protein